MKRILVLLVLPFVMAACAPVSASKAISRAEAAMTAASDAGADDKCPYEMTAAAAYLEYARTRQGMAEYEAAAEFADKAVTLAEQAKARAVLTADGNRARLDAGATR